MADATRLQSAIREAEERFAATIEPSIDERMRGFEERIKLSMESRFNSFQETLRGVGLQMAELSTARRTRGGGDGEHRVATRLTRLDFPKFNREDVDSWLAKCERFFALDSTPEDDRVAVASIALDESSFRWFQSLEQSTVGRLAWKEFATAVKIRFGLEFESPMEELKRLVQTGSLDEYQEAFDNLIGRTELTEGQKLQCYLGGLNAELSNGVKMFAPRTVLEATRMAKLQERSFELLQKRMVPVSRGYGNWSEKKNVSVLPEKKAFQTDKKAQNDNTQKSILGKPNYTFQKKLTPKELDEHRAQNLCFFCHEKYSPGHKRTQRKKLQVFLMEVHDEELPEGEQEGEMEVIDTASGVPRVSLNALNGNGDSSDEPMMRLTGWIGKRKIFVLMDTGSTHNFIDQKLCKAGLVKLKPLQPVSITVADGGLIQSSGWCEDVHWKMQGYNFSANTIAIPLTSCDLILGMQWLKQWGKISWDFANLVMEFNMGGIPVVLHAMEEQVPRVVSTTKLNHMMLEDKVCCMLHLIPCCQGLVCCNVTTAETDLTQQQELLLQDFQDVFEEPNSLPPFRGIHDHKIILKEGSNPVSLRPYRYPPAQKDVIDTMVKELLNSGVIQPSSSPFASPVV
ncbi:uncharacterized protein LOC130711837 [Lotus japonicus]|uniref:uncharacterized protein LOC130711837 n=1 Tax=Lotus japonicus TaxID=34305 RepID=UPI00258AC59F|nr:uncharacterized protein LOC130711837 [Lotus japonicus]